MSQVLKGGILFLAVGVVCIVGGASPIYDYQQSVDRAEAVDGEILSSDWERVSNPSDEGTDYRVEITYRFTYEGTEYTRDEVFPDGRNGGLSRSSAESTAENHPAGDEVTVYVVDGDPEDTYLVQDGLALRYYLLPAFGVLLSFLGAQNVVQWARADATGASDD